MEAFHSFWTKPGRKKNNGKMQVADYDLLTMILSALEWKQHNGRVVMKTDSFGAEYFQRGGLLALWDAVDVTLDGVPGGMDPFLFWAAGKLYALQSMTCPCVMIDTDLILWKDIRPRLEDRNVVAAHEEELRPSTYPDPGTFAMREGYAFPAEWDFSLRAANTAFLYIRDNDFKNTYVAHAIAFMENFTGNATPVTAMCFAEQRVLPMCVKAAGLQIGYLLRAEEACRQDFITHIWGFKRAMELSGEYRDWFCVKCVRRILHDFPSYAGMVAGHPSLAKYYRMCQEQA